MSMIPKDSVEVLTTPAHQELMRGISKVIADFMRKNPQMQAIEIIAAVGSVAGAAPDDAERNRARQSAIHSMDATITDFMKLQTPGAGSA